MGNGRQVPYSTVTALDDPAGLYLADGRPAPALADDAIYLDAWTAQELAATPGDSISLTYYIVGPRHELRTEQAHFRLQGIVQMRGLAIDPTLTPEYPGLQEEGDISAWDAPFPIDMGQIPPAGRSLLGPVRGRAQSLRRRPNRPAPVGQPPRCADRHPLLSPRVHPSAELRSQPPPANEQ